MIARTLDYEAMTDSEKTKEQSTKSTSTQRRASRHWYSVPEPIRRVFDQFPLRTYRENSVPQRTRRQSSRNTLYIFANPLDKATNLSCNPACLKWQAYLKCHQIDFSVLASNNHASPSGSLPFLLTEPSLQDPAPLPLTTGNLVKWVSQQRMKEEDYPNIQQQAYMALVEQNLRNAWLYHLYLVTENFVAVAYPLYVTTASSNGIVKAAIAYQLKDAAKTELLKTLHAIDGQDILQAAEKAMDALSTLLGSDNFYGCERPDLFDASVFAYTHLLLDKSLPWRDTTLSDMLSEYPRLVEHRNRILDDYLIG